MTTYCQYALDPKTPGHELHKEYHDTQYGFPIHCDNELFGRLILEINQAGLSWLTILKKQNDFRTTFHNFDISRIATLDNGEIDKLLSNSSIIRNRLKINAVTHNAKAVLELQKTHGSFKNWLDNLHPQPLENWVKTFRKTFKFTGPEITKEFLLSCGYTPGAHTHDCPIHTEILTLKPAWASKK